MQAVLVTVWPAGRWAWSKWAWSTHATVSASQEQTLSSRGARVYTAHRGWVGVVTGISAASTGSVLVTNCQQYGNELLTGKTGSRVAIIKRGITSSTRASGPCFSSPAMMPSECMYVNSLNFYRTPTQPLSNASRADKITLTLLIRQYLSSNITTTCSRFLV